ATQNITSFCNGFGILEGIADERLAAAAARASATNGSVIGKLGSTSTAMRAALGSNSCKSPQCFAAVAIRKVTPVMLPPGRLKLPTRPSLTGSPPLTKTIGMVAVAALAAIAEGVSCAAITAT